MGYRLPQSEYQVPVLLPLLAAEAEHQGWQLGQPFVIRHGRVGVLNDIGEILNPTIVVLLIGERQGWPLRIAFQPTWPSGHVKVMTMLGAT